MLDGRRFVIVGAGMVGRTLAGALHARGLAVAAVACRRLEAAREAADSAGGGLATTDAA
ncbi:MAG: 3-oxoacyl-ACP reductase, partial [Planctomycetota bacterium]